MHSAPTLWLLLPTGGDGKDSEGLPCVGDCGDSSPVVCSIAGPVVDSEVDEPDAEELESLGCIHAANRSTRTIAAMPNRMACEGFIMTPYGWVSRPRRRRLREASRQRLARWNGRRRLKHAVPSGCRAHDGRHPSAASSRDPLAITSRSRCLIFSWSSV